MNQQIKSPLKSNRGAVLLITVVVMSLILLTIVAVGSHQISLLSKESYRLNEGLKYTVIMEEMGQIVANAYSEAQGGVASCPAGKTRVAMVAQSGATKQICLPNAGVVGQVCINREVTLGGAPEVYCLIPGTAAAPPGAPRPGIFFVTQNQESSTDSVFVLNIEKRESPSLFAKFFKSVFSNTAVAVPLGEPWRYSNNPAPPPATPYIDFPASPASIPDLAAVPATGSLESTGGAYSGGGNMEPWRPTPAWAGVNEIYIPDCSNQAQQRVGCMTCNAPGVTCVEFRMCPPSNLACTDPYVQRIAVF